MAERILSRCVENEAGCWIWTGAVFKNGYGAVSVDGNATTAHRAMMQSFVGRDAIQGKDICHKCDVRLCCNPAHLFVGSRSENMADCVSKGRMNNWNTAKTHCPKGHEYSDGNAYMHNGKRYCLTCKKAKRAR
jgi:hypothetical protein